VIDLNEVGFIIPTLGRRPDYLIECLESIKDAGCKHITLVGPLDKLKVISKLDSHGLNFIQDPGKGLAEAINFGVANLPRHVLYFGWLGDDDRLTKKSISNSLKIFEEFSNAVATYGRCQYISPDGSNIFLNRSGPWASKYMRFLPNLIPQPGSLIKRSTFELIGGVKSTFPLSFDFEMFFNLRRHGLLVFINETQSQFRWHAGSLSVDERNQAVKQTSEIRKSNQSYFLRKLSIIWEPILMYSTILIGTIINKRMK
jgi:GT2 family glycosyltransferase